MDSATLCCFKELVDAENGALPIFFLGAIRSVRHKVPSFFVEAKKVSTSYMLAISVLILAPSFVEAGEPVRIQGEPEFFNCGTVLYESTRQEPADCSGSRVRNMQQNGELVRESRSEPLEVRAEYLPFEHIDSAPPRNDATSNGTDESRSELRGKDFGKPIGEETHIGGVLFMYGIGFILGWSCGYLLCCGAGVSPCFPRALFSVFSNVEVSGLRGFSRRSARLKGYASISLGIFLPALPHELFVET